MDEARLRRAGLDYWEYARVVEHESFDAFLDSVEPQRLFAVTGRASTRYDQLGYREGDAFLFGKESTGLPDELIDHPAVEEALRIPMLPERRSLNLANAVAIVLFEAWRQSGFRGGV